MQDVAPLFAETRGALLHSGDVTAAGVPLEDGTTDNLLSRRPLGFREGRESLLQLIVDTQGHGHEPHGTNLIPVTRPSDTTACLAGGMAGAVFGMGGIPSR